MRLLCWLSLLTYFCEVSYSQADSIVVQLTNGTVIAYAVSDVKTIRFDGTTTNIQERERLESIVQSFTLRQNYPNPFNPSTTIEYELPDAGHVEVALFDMTGRMIRQLDASDRQRGVHRIVWNGRDDSGRTVASGVYLSRVRYRNSVLTKRLVLVK